MKDEPAQIGDRIPGEPRPFRIQFGGGELPAEPVQGIRRLAGKSAPQKKEREKTCGGAGGWRDFNQSAYFKNVAAKRK